MQTNSAARLRGRFTERPDLGTIQSGYDNASLPAQKQLQLIQPPQGNSGTKQLYHMERDGTHANHISLGKSIGIVGSSGSEMVLSLYISKKRCGATCGR
jgi:hypothetical protein